MKTSSRFHRVVTVAFAAVFAAVSARTEGAPVSVTVMNAEGAETLSTDGANWQSSVTMEAWNVKAKPNLDLNHTLSCRFYGITDGNIRSGILEKHGVDVWKNTEWH